MAPRATSGTELITTPPAALPEPLSTSQTNSAIHNKSTGIRFLQLELDTVSLLSRLYMPMVLHGGIFVPSNIELPALNQRIFLTLVLGSPDGPYKQARTREANSQIVTLTRVVWLYNSPNDSPGSGRRGYGLQLESDDDSIQSLFETLIAEQQRDVPENPKGEGEGRRATKEGENLEERSKQGAELKGRTGRQNEPCLTF